MLRAVLESRRAPSARWRTLAPLSATLVIAFATDRRSGVRQRGRPRVRVSKRLASAARLLSAAPGLALGRRQCFGGVSGFSSRYSASCDAGPAIPGRRRSARDTGISRRSHFKLPQSSRYEMRPPAASGYRFANPSERTGNSRADNRNGRNLDSPGLGRPDDCFHAGAARCHVGPARCCATVESAACASRSRSRSAARRRRSSTTSRIP